MANGWITSRSPKESDSHWTCGDCVEVTYKNGLIGWEPVMQLLRWKHHRQSEVIAWRKIRPVFVATSKQAAKKKSR